MKSANQESRKKKCQILDECLNSYKISSYEHKIQDFLLLKTKTPINSNKEKISLSIQMDKGRPDKNLNTTLFTMYKLDISLQIQISKFPIPNGYGGHIKNAIFNQLYNQNLQEQVQFNLFNKLHEILHQKEKEFIKKFCKQVNQQKNTKQFVQNQEKVRGLIAFALNQNNLNKCQLVFGIMFMKLRQIVLKKIQEMKQPDKYQENTTLNADIVKLFSKICYRISWQIDQKCPKTLAQNLYQIQQQFYRQFVSSKIKVQTTFSNLSIVFKEQLEKYMQFTQKSWIFEQEQSQRLKQEFENHNKTKVQISEKRKKYRQKKHRQKKKNYNNQNIAQRQSNEKRKKKKTIEMNENKKQKQRSRTSQQYYQKYEDLLQQDFSISQKIKYIPEINNLQNIFNKKDISEKKEKQEIDNAQKINNFQAFLHQILQESIEQRSNQIKTSQKIFQETELKPFNDLQSAIVSDLNLLYEGSQKMRIDEEIKLSIHEYEYFNNEDSFYLNLFKR